jgi:hypothetical protein
MQFKDKGAKPEKMIHKQWLKKIHAC